MTTETVLLIGYGNPGRMDDGLGPACAAAVEQLRLEGVRVDANYQLNVEDAADVAEYDVVVFADASVNGPEPFGFEPLLPCADAGFSSHSIEPAALLAMARDLFDGKPRAFALGIRGYEFNEFGERLSDAARRNLEQAVEFIAGVIRDHAFDRYARDAAGGGEKPPAVILEMTPADWN